MAGPFFVWFRRKQGAETICQRPGPVGIRGSVSDRTTPDTKVTLSELFRPGLHPVPAEPGTHLQILPPPQRRNPPPGDPPGATEQARDPEPPAERNRIGGRAPGATDGAGPNRPPGQDTARRAKPGPARRRCNKIFVLFRRHGPPGGPGGDHRKPGATAPPPGRYRRARDADRPDPRKGRETTTPGFV